MAMIEAYRIGVELVLGGDLAAGIDALIPSLARLDDSLVHANADARALASGLETVAATAPGLDRAADAVGRLNAAMVSMNRAVEGWRAAGGMAAVTGDRPTRMPGTPAERRNASAAGAANVVETVLPTIATSDAASGSAAEPHRQDRGLRMVGPSDVPMTGQAVAVTAPVASGAERTAEESNRPMHDGAAGLAAILTAVQGVPAETALAGRNVDAKAIGNEGPSVPAMESIAKAPLPTRAASDLATVLPRLVERRNDARLDRPAVQADGAGKTEPVVKRSLGIVRDVVLPHLGGEQRTGKPWFDPWDVRQSQGNDEVGRHAAVRLPLLEQPTPKQTGETSSTTIAPGPVSAMPRAAVTSHRRASDTLDRVTDWLRDQRGTPARGTPTGTLPVVPAAVTTMRGPVPNGIAESRIGLSAFAGGLAVSNVANRLPVALQSGVEGAAIGKLATRTAQIVAEGGRRSNSIPLGAAPYRAMETTRPAGTHGLDSLASYHKQGEQGGPVIQHVTYIQLDERTIARAVTRQQLRMMGGQVSGTLRPDPSIAPQYGAHLLEN